jgi:large subunit ribosomal protein L4
MIQLTVKNLSDYNQDYDHIEYPDQLFLLRCKNEALQFVYSVDCAIKSLSFSHTKDRGEVAGTTKKMYRQKGTGGARHGTMRASQFRGGGVTFGPKFSTKRIKINKNLKSLAVLTALNKHIERGSVFVVNDLFVTSYKTKEFNLKIKNFFSNSIEKNSKITELVKNKLKSTLGLDEFKSILKKYGFLFIDSVRDEYDESFKNFLLASKNIIGSKYIDVNSLNISDLMNYGVIYITKDAILKIIERFQNKLFKNKDSMIIYGQ